MRLMRQPDPSFARFVGRSFRPDDILLLLHRNPNQIGTQQVGQI